MFQALGLRGSYLSASSKAWRASGNFFWSMRALPLRMNMPGSGACLRMSSKTVIASGSLFIRYRALPLACLAKICWFFGRGLSLMDNALSMVAMDSSKRFARRRASPLLYQAWE